jgi:hypothetical protein
LTCQQEKEFPLTEEIAASNFKRVFESIVVSHQQHRHVEGNMYKACKNCRERRALFESAAAEFHVAMQESSLPKQRREGK